MSIDTRGILLVILLSAVGVAADTVLKVASTQASPFKSGWFVLGCGLSLGFAVVWMQLMHHVKFGAAGLLYAIVSALLLILLGVTMFGETLSKGELAGVAMALGSIVLLGRVSE
jgi:small multidrug resistance pump